MTLEEKMSQMVYQSPAIERLGIPAYNWWNEALHGVARAGVATVFPQAIGLAATFDKSCCRRSVMLFLPRDVQNSTSFREKATAASTKA